MALDIHKFNYTQLLYRYYDVKLHFSEELDTGKNTHF